MLAQQHVAQTLEGFIENDSEQPEMAGDMCVRQSSNFRLDTAEWCSHATGNCNMAQVSLGSSNMAQVSLDGNGLNVDKLLDAELSALSA